MKQLRVFRFGLLGLLALMALFAGPTLPAHAATFTVDSTGDGGDNNPGDGVCDDGTGDCTLRAAIEQANALAGADTIAFGVPGTGPYRIQPGSPLSDITDPVTIDGTTQTGFTGTPIIQLDGTGAGESWGCLTITAGNSTVRGLVIHACSQSGIALRTNGGNTIEGNFIGTDVTGTIAVPNGWDGVAINGAGSNTIGGTTAGAGNVISGNANCGVSIDSSANLVQGNFIGTDATGGVALGNGVHGIGIEGSGNTIGGTTAAARNVISGNHTGIFILGNTSTGNLVQGNYLGTDVTGTVALGNGHGVTIPEAPSNTIGGTTAGAGNVISGNEYDGVVIGRFIGDSDATDNLVQGNFIGTDVTGMLALGNGGHGVFIHGAPFNMIGGTVAGAANTIAHNVEDGVQVDGTSSTGNTIRGNSIHSHTGMGIENSDGGNTELAPPVITAAGSASGTACTDCKIDIFSDDDDEGRIYEGSTTADGDGNWSFAGTVTGPNVTATATDADGNTSEFSDPFPLQGTCDGLPATIVGTNGNDVLVGTLGPDVIVALDGNDFVIDLWGNDIICAGPGQVDRVYDFNGNDRIFGEAGVDLILAGNGDDFLDGGPGFDLCAGGAGSDTAVACELTFGVP